VLSYSLHPSFLLIQILYQRPAEWVDGGRPAIYASRDVQPAPPVASHGSFRFADARGSYERLTFGPGSSSSSGGDGEGSNQSGPLEPLAPEVRVWTRDNVSMEGSIGEPLLTADRKPPGGRACGFIWAVAWFSIEPQSATLAPMLPFSLTPSVRAMRASFVNPLGR